MKRCPICQRTFPDTAAFCSADATALVPQSGDPAVGRVVGGRYRIEQLIGKGGMGSVYAATQLEIGRRVALKLLNRELVSDPQAVERFRREARAAGRLQHPNAITVYDFGVEDGGEAFLAMELLDGTTLRDELVRRGPMVPAETAAVLRQVAEAVAAAHAEGIVHRDLKPDNIMLVARGGSRVVKVLDFGIAKLAEPAHGPGTLTGTGAIGTPFYMSPEQGEGRQLDWRSDIYSLGVIAFEMLTGRVPFVADTPIATVVKHLNTPPPRPSEIVPSLAGAVDAVVLRALAKEPARRHQSAVELVDDLERAARGGDARTVPISGATIRVPGSTNPEPPLSLDMRYAVQPTDPAVQPTTGGSRAGLAVAAVIALAIVLAGVAGIVAYLYWPDTTPGASQVPTPAGPSPGPTPIVPTPAKGSRTQDQPGRNVAENPPAETAEAPDRVAVAATATSSRATQGSNVFTADRAIDGRFETGWCEGADGEGLGEGITLTFPRPVRVRSLRIAPGYFKSQDRWTNNNRVARAVLELSSGERRTVSFVDEMRAQTVAVGSEPVTSITIRIAAVYPGGDEQDTLISEIEVVTE